MVHKSALRVLAVIFLLQSAQRFTQGAQRFFVLLEVPICKNAEGKLRFYERSSF